MPNKNPITTKDTLETLDFLIPKKFKDSILYLSTKTEITSEGWRLNLIHAVNLQGIPQTFDPDPDINRMELGKCSELNGIQFYLSTKASRFRDGSDSKTSKVKYTIKFEANDELIDDEFTLFSTDRNPFTFYTFLTLKIEP